MRIVSLREIFFGEIGASCAHDGWPCGCWTLLCFTRLGKNVISEIPEQK